MVAPLDDCSSTSCARAGNAPSRKQERAMPWTDRTARDVFMTAPLLVFQGRARTPAESPGKCAPLPKHREAGQSSPPKKNSKARNEARGDGVSDVEEECGRRTAAGGLRSHGAAPGAGPLRHRVADHRSRRGR